MHICMMHTKKERKKERKKTKRTKRTKNKVPVRSAFAEIRLSLDVTVVVRRRSN